MKTLAVSGSAGNDLQIRIDSVKCLPPLFQKYMRKTVAYSKIPELYGSDWSIEKVLELLGERSTRPACHSYGGRAPHVAYGVARLGGDVRLITVFGSDLHEPYPGFFGGGYWDHLIRSGVKMSLLEVEVPEDVWSDEGKMADYLRDKYGEEMTAKEAISVCNKKTPTIVCGKDTESTDFFYIDDVNGAGRLELARPAPVEALRFSDVIFVTTSEPSFMEHVVQTGHRLNKEVMMDVGSYGISTPYLRNTVPLAKILFGNPIELGQVCTAFNVKRLEDIFYSTGTNLPEMIVLEDKHEGYVVLMTRDGSKKIGPVPLRKTGNSIGCCDGIASGFLALYQREMDVETCAKAGLVFCSAIWEVEGVQEGIPNKEDFHDRFLGLFGKDSSGRELQVLEEILFKD